MTRLRECTWVCTFISPLPLACEVEGSQLRGRRVSGVCPVWSGTARSELTEHREQLQNYKAMTIVQGKWNKHVETCKEESLTSNIRNDFHNWSGNFPAPLDATRRAWWLWSMSEEAFGQSEHRQGDSRPMRSQHLDQSPSGPEGGWGAVGVSEAVVTPGPPLSGFPQSFTHNNPVEAEASSCWTKTTSLFVCAWPRSTCPMFWPWRCYCDPWPDRRGAGWR